MSNTPQSGWGEYVGTGLPEDPGVTVVQFERSGKAGIWKELGFEAQPSGGLNPAQFLGRVADAHSITVLDQIDLLPNEVQEVQGPNRRKHLLVNDNGQPNANLISTWRNRLRLRRSGYQVYRFDPKEKARVGGVRRMLTLLAKGDNAHQQELRDILAQEDTALDAQALIEAITLRKTQEQEAGATRVENQMGSSNENPVVLRSVA